MKQPNIFMTGKWTDLIISTYEVKKELLMPYLPIGTELDLYRGKPLMSIVAFTFSKVNFFGRRVPFHQHFGQINFRFYVKSKTNNKRGVVFIKEFAPKPIIACIANVFYNEPFFFKKIGLKKDDSSIEYNYKRSRIKASLISSKQSLKEKSLEHFIVDRYIAFVKSRKSKTLQYKIFHKPWNLYKTKLIKVDQTILNLLPSKFSNIKCISNYFVDGSSVKVEKGVLQN